MISWDDVDSWFSSIQPQRCSAVALLPCSVLLLSSKLDTGGQLQRELQGACLQKRVFPAGQGHVPHQWDVGFALLHGR